MHQPTDESLLVWLSLAVFLWHQTAYAPASPAPPAYTHHMTGDGELAAAIEQNGATVLTLCYEPLRGEAGLAASTPWLKFVEIGVRR